MKIDKQNLKQVRIEDFDVTALRRAAREGRLYLMPAVLNEDEERELCECKFLDYVCQINDCACEEYQPLMRQIWTDVIRDPMFSDMVMMRQGRHRGEPNKYRAHAMITVLLNRGIYRSEFTVVDLHHRLEHSTRRNVFYTAMNQYLLEHVQMVQLMKIVKSRVV